VDYINLSLNKFLNRYTILGMHRTTVSVGSFFHNAGEFYSMFALREENLLACPRTHGGGDKWKKLWTNARSDPSAL
jgi:hypothetical protein